MYDAGSNAAKQHCHSTPTTVEKEMRFANWNWKPIERFQIEEHANEYLRSRLFFLLYCFTPLIISVFFFKHTKQSFFAIYSFCILQKFRPRWVCSTEPNETFNNNLAKRNILSSNKITLYHDIQTLTHTHALTHKRQFIRYTFCLAIDILIILNC